MSSGVGNLQRLFESEYFDAWMCVLYLDKYAGNAGVADYLCAKLNTFPDEAVEAFLPQLCNMYLYSPLEPAGPLEGFLTDRCAKSMHFALILWWQLDAEVGDGMAATVSRAAKMREVVESCAINGTALNHRQRHSTLEDGDEMAVFRYACEKQRRCTYWETELQFVRELCNFSLNLRTLPQKDTRVHNLRTFLRKLNSSLWEKGRLSRRVSFPLLCHSGSRYQVLLCIKPHEAVVLNSRERTPYMVYLEVMQLDCTCAAPNLSYLGGPDMEPQSLAGFPQTQDSPSSPPAAASGAAPAAAPPGPGDSGGRPASARGSTPPPRTLLAAAPSHTLLQTGAAFWPQEMVLEDARFLSYGESWAVRRERIRKQSPNGHLPGWDIKSCIVKAGDDIRQEVLAMQLIKTLHKIWVEARLPVFLRPYDVVAVSNSTGLIETVPDAVSLDSIKKSLPSNATLLQYFTQVYGAVDSPTFRMAQRNFTESLVGYSILTYLLQVKDRHNGNILLTRQGSLVHIDFGFILASSPGGMNFESAPFKLPAEYVEVMGGTDSDTFQYFRVLMFAAFLQCRKHMERIVTLVRVMLPGGKMPCFAGDGRRAVEELEARFNLALPEADLVVWIRDMIESSIDNWRTRQYDNFQYMTNGILP